MNMGIPHFALPFRVDNGAVVTTEQDSVDEIADCVQAVVVTPVGTRVEMPGFGMSSPVLTQSDSVPSTAILAALRRWEPRAAASVTDGSVSVSTFALFQGPKWRIAESENEKGDFSTLN
jgi:phage baseplate assembly protein W